MTTRAAFAVLLALVLSACAGTERSDVPSRSPSRSPESSPPADCVNPPPDVTALIEQADPVACYGGDELTFDAHLTTQVGVIDCPGGLEPAWLACSGLVALSPLPETSTQPRVILAMVTQGPEPLYAVLHPDIEELRPRIVDVLVTVTGHYDDPAARDCHHTSWPDAFPPRAEEVVHGCRSTFVITAVAPLEPVPAPTSTFERGDIVQAVETDIVVRSAPGTGADSEIYPETVSAPTLLYVFDGPVQLDGYDWYQVLPADFSPLPSPYRLGWLAAGSQDGAPWITAAEPECPDPMLDEIVVLSDTARLACFADEQLVLEGKLGFCRAATARTDGSGEALLLLPWSDTCSLLTFECCPNVVPDAGWLTIVYRADVSVPFGEGDAIRVSGHFDDVDAASCEVTSDTWVDGRLEPIGNVPPAGWGEFLCRTQFVATDVELLPGS